MALDEINGIRLTDIYGYDKSSFNKFVNNNMSKIDSIYTANLNVDSGLDDKDVIATHLYINSLLRDKLGEERFKEDAASLTLDDKISYYNNISEQPLESNSGEIKIGDFDGSPININYTITPNITNSNKDTYEATEIEWRNGNVNPLTYSNNPGTMSDWFKKMINLDIYGEKSLETPQNFDMQLVKRLYNPEYSLEEESVFNSPMVDEKINNYASEIRNKLNSDTVFANNVFNRFDEIADSVSSYYKNYKNSGFIDFTPNEMKQIMSLYYSTLVIKGEDEANKLIASTFQNEVSNNQGWTRKLANGAMGAVTSFSGSMITLAGMFKSLPYAIIMAARQDKDIEGINGLQELLFYASQDDWVKYGTNLMETGEFNKDKQDEYMESGYRKYENVRNYGREGKFWDVNTFYDLLPQIGFSLAGGIQGSLAGFAIKQTLGRATIYGARKLLTNAATSELRKVAGKSVSYLGKGIVVAGSAFVPAATESLVDGVQTYNNLMLDNNEALDRRALQEALKDRENGKFEEYYNLHANPLRIPLGELGNEYSDEEVKIIGAQRAKERDDLFEQYVKEKRDELVNNELLQKEVQNAAIRASARNMSDEILIITLLDSFCSSLLGAPAKDAKRAIRNMSQMDNSKYTLSRTIDGALRVGADDTMGKATARGFRIGVGELLSEGTQEMGQFGSSEMRQDLAYNYIEKVMDSLNDPDAIKQYSDIMWQNLEAVNESLNENLFSDEALYSFAMGAAGALLGTPRIVSGTVATIKAKKSGLKQSALDVINNFYRNTVLENVLDEREKFNELKQEVADINAWLESHDNIAKMRDVTSILSWLNSADNAASLNNEADYRDALMGNKIATLMMMDRIGGSATEQSFASKIKQLSELTMQSDNAESVIRQAAVLQGIENPTDEQKQNILNDIVKRAKETLELRDKIKTAKFWVESNYGTMLSRESIDAWTYSEMMLQDNANRIQDIRNTIKTAINSASTRYVASSNTTMAQNAIARHGNLENAQRNLKRLKEELSEKQKDKNNLEKKYGVYGYKNMINSIKDDIKKAENDVILIKENPDVLVSLTDVSGLDSDAMAALMDKNNYKNYSSKQREQINAFKTLNTVNKDILDSIQDLNTLQRRYDTFNKQAKEIQLDSRNMILYEHDVRKKVARHAAEKLLGPAQEAVRNNDYDSYKEFLNDFFDENNDPLIRAAGNDLLKGSDFYKQYLSERKNQMGDIAVMNSTPAYKELSEEQKTLFNKAYLKGLQDGDISFSNILKYLGSEDDDFLRNVNEILKQVENHRKVVDEINKRRDLLSGKRMPTDRNEDVDKVDDESKTVMNKKIYDSQKSTYETIIKSMIPFFNNRVKHIKMTKDNFVKFLQLFSKNEIPNEFLIEIDPLLSVKGLSRLSESLGNSLDTAASLNAKAYNDIKFKNTLALKMAVDKLLETAMISKLSNNESLSQALKNYVLEVDPSFNAILNPIKRNNRGKINRLGKFSVLSRDAVATEAEREFYNQHDIPGNIKTIGKINSERSSTNPLPFIYIYDNELAGRILAETGDTDFNSDTLPIIVAAIVPDGTDGAIKIDGHNILYAGLINKSRDLGAMEMANSLNVLRQFVIDTKQTGIIKNPDNTLYMSKGCTTKVNAPINSENGAYGSIKDKLLEKHNNDADAAFRDFQSHLVEVHQKIDHSTRKVTNTWTWGKKTYHKSYDALEGTWQNKDQDTNVVPAYIDESNPSHPVMLFTNEIENIEVDGKTLFEIMDTENILEDKFDEIALYHVREAIKVTRDELRRNFDNLTSHKRVKGLSERITYLVDKNHLNLARKHSQSAPNLLIDFYYENGNLYMQAYDRTAQNPDVMVLNVVQIKPNERNIRGILNKFVQEGYKNLMFDKDGQPRKLSKNGGKYNIVKIQSKYNNLWNVYNIVDGEKVLDEDKTDIRYQEKVFNSNMLKGIVYHMGQEVTEIEVNETVNDNPDKTITRKQAAIDALNKIITQQGTKEAFEQRAKEEAETGKKYTGTTTFIKKYEDEDKVVDISVEQQETPHTPDSSDVAMSLGTSVDQLIRIYFETLGTATKPEEKIENIKKWMIKSGLGADAYWTGIGTMSNGLPEFIRQIEKIETFFAGRHETVIPTRFRLYATIYDKKDKSRFQKITMEPDIVTIDEYGKYHIYDMKSFKYNKYSRSNIPSLNNKLGYIYNGLGGEDYKLQTWKEQLSIYKAVFEQLLGDGCVSSLGVIPIALDYELPSNNIGIEEVDKPQIGGTRNKLYEVKLYSDDSRTRHKKLRVGSRTTIYKDVIEISPITDLTTIRPEKWGPQSSSSDIQFEKPNTGIGNISGESYDDIVAANAPIVDNTFDRQKDADTVAEESLVLQQEANQMADMLGCIDLDSI